DMRARLATQQSLTRQLPSHKAQIDDLLGQQKRLLAGLQADQRRALAASRRTFVPTASRERSVAPPVVEGNASARAMIAVRAALAQLGKPYQWGAAGPSTFDCSGLTMWAWGKAGVSLPHYTGAQWNVGRHISRAELQPGDLVFYYSDLHHMAMYIGGGRVVHAPHTGDVVKTGPLDLDPYEGAVRVLG
ncbi:MAG: C40 family peptidase, partial [Actinomycetes bacterium]